MSNLTDTLQTGDMIGCYRIDSVLGRGGFAVTYLATDTNLDVEVAIKEYLPREITRRDANLHVTARKDEYVEDYETGLQSFSREAKTLARFKHPNIVRVHQVLHANNTAYMVMDFEQGQELSDVLEQHGTLTEVELRSILFPILDGVEEIHRHGFVHRDIKPSNIYIRHNGSPVLIDFGAARYTMSETTQQLTAVVTVGYTPIEQYNVSEDTQGPWSDIYALAAVCYEAVTGAVPTDSVTRASASLTKGDDPLPSVRHKAHGEYSDDCLDAIDWGLRMEAEDRPQVTAQWRDSFDGIFNPATAYISNTSASIYSPHRVETPLASAAANSQHSASHDDLVQVPLRNNDDPSGNTRDVARQIDPSQEPMVPGARDTERVSHMPPVPTRDTATVQPASREPAPTLSTQRNYLRPADVQKSQTPPEPPQRQRSKLERPPELEGTSPKRVLRDEIEFDESDWGYEPPQQQRSGSKLLFPALALAAVVGGSILFANNPTALSSLFNRDSAPQLTTAEAIEIAQTKMNQSDFIFPAGESAFDYYQLILTSDPENIDARAGIESIEAAVEAQIAAHVRNDNLSEANRLLSRASENGLLRYSAGAIDTQPQTENVAPATTNTTETIVNTIERETIEPVAIAPTESTSQNTTQTAEIQSAANKEAEDLANAQAAEEANTTYLAAQVAKIETLIDQERFDEARAVYRETDRFIPDQQVSNALMLSIENAEQISRASTNSTPAPEVVPEPAPITQPAPEPQSQIAQRPDPQPAEQSAPSAPRISFVDAQGPVADHLNQLREAIESKDIDRVTSVSSNLPAGRVQHLTRLFKIYDRLDVTIVDVVSRGDTTTATLNVSMFNERETGGYYLATKWDGAALRTQQQDGVWQEISW